MPNSFRELIKLYICVSFLYKRISVNYCATKSPCGYAITYVELLSP